MNPNFRLGWGSRRTLRALSRAIGPVELDIAHLEDEVVDHIERLLRNFPRLHRFGFLLGLWFVEWGGPLGAWGVAPLSLLSRRRATRRLYVLSRSRFAPLRLFVTGVRVLISLNAYGHPKVEQAFGFQRRAWRAQRQRTRVALLRRDQITDAGHTRATRDPHLPPVPETLYTPQDQESIDLLAWRADLDITATLNLDPLNLDPLNLDPLNLDPLVMSSPHDEDAHSPFQVEDYIPNPSLSLTPTPPQDKR